MSEKLDQSQGQSLTSLLSALGVSAVVFAVQASLFLVLRTKLARIFKPKTYLVPERERTDPPPQTPWGLVNALLRFKDREIIKKCGLDSYFFLRYLQTLLLIFIPIAFVVIPILVPINYIGGTSNDFDINNDTEEASSNKITGLDTLAWGNIDEEKTNRYWAHLILALAVIVWVCTVFFFELRVYIKVRQDWLTTAEHRLRASATTVLVSGIPDKWLSEESLRGLFDVFPGGIRNIWLNRDFSPLLEKIQQREKIHQQLEVAQSDLIREAKRKQLKKREREEKAARKASRARRVTKEEKLERQKMEDAAAQTQAQAGQGVSSGNQHQPHTLDEVVHEQQHDDQASSSSSESDDNNALSTGFNKFTKGLEKGAGFIAKTGHGIVGSGRHFGERLDSEVETTNGFSTIGPAPVSKRGHSTRAPGSLHMQADEKDFARSSYEISPASARAPVMGAMAAQPRHGYNGSIVSQDRDTMLNKNSIEMQTFNNTTRKASNLDGMYVNEVAHWYQFWKPPSGGFASPIPQAVEGAEFPFGEKKKKTFMEKLKAISPFSSAELEPIEFDVAYTDEAKEAMENEQNAEWEKWVKKSSRPTHRLPYADWMFPIPFVNKQVDTIYWCRAELARLNVEIEADQNHPERYPLMKSAFIQFNHQVAAHMACQSVIHHVPKHMAPRTVEISPNDVIWDNMAIPWWSEWLRTLGVVAFVVGMILLWALPVGFTSSLAKVDTLIETLPFLSFVEKDATLTKIAQGIAGVLPAILLAVLLILVPIIMDYLASLKGAKTGSQKSEIVQQFYFAFLFVQVFIIVSITANLTEFLRDIAGNPASIPDKLATSIPRGANYFFSYMILQALSVSSGTLLQIGALFSWYILAKLTSNTARQKWKTQTQLPDVRWGSYFPVYTNFACIALVYCIIAPIISIFAIITFSLLWIANRYTMLYVNRFTHDTGGVLYPRAINQTFVGLYFMEVCMIGLFFLVRDQNQRVVCSVQAIIMVVATILTALYQFLLNMSFGPMFRYLPITVEDEAVLRDQAFQRAQDRRLGLIRNEDDENTDKESGLLAGHRNEARDSSDEAGAGVQRRSSRRAAFKPLQMVVGAGKNFAQKNHGKAEARMQNATRIRDAKKNKDLEAQRAIGDALYGGFHDEIEDLTPEERDALVKRAFTHSALRAVRPTVWIPRDDLGVSDDEIRRTKEFSEHIWISNEGTALDSKVRVVYGRAPPDFSEVDIMIL
ncbi:Calcium-dependent channel, 7TM region, putative phosphate [Microdochium nivale]|nr:Calcium-dependent channel, 7TM region, putative phosphate [Microdochium nivale]